MERRDIRPLTSDQAADDVIREVVVGYWDRPVIDVVRRAVERAYFEGMLRTLDEVLRNDAFDPAKRPRVDHLFQKARTYVGRHRKEAERTIRRGRSS